LPTDSPSLSPEEKVARLDRLESDLLGTTTGSLEAAALRRELNEHDLSPQHAQDLLKAFRLDATKRRYLDWDDLIGYCSYSAMPVGRYVLDVHGESHSTWHASDAICAALQVINHLQDCGEDYRNLDRVYVPQDALAAAGVDVEALGEAKAAPALRRCIAGLAERTEALLGDGDSLAVEVEDGRLGLEISVIHGLARRIVAMLKTRDPLSERVHLGKGSIAGSSLLAAIRGTSRRLGRRHRQPSPAALP
jgi:squalene synthase HpnC